MYKQEWKFIVHDAITRKILSNLVNTYSSQETYLVSQIIIADCLIAMGLAL